MWRVLVMLAGVILPVAVALFPTSRAVGQPPAAAPAPLRIGLPESMFHGLPPAVVAPAAKPFQSMFEKQTGLKGEVVTAKDYAEITNKLCNGTIDIAVFHGFEYAWVRHEKDLVPLLITVPGNKLQACLVVHTTSKANGAKDLQGECVALPSTTKAHCRIYFDRLKEGLPQGCCGIAKLEGNSVEEALDAVASGTCTAALVDNSALAAYQNNKPGVGTQLKILEQSTEFPSAVIVYRKDAFNAQTAVTIRDGLIKGITTPQGKLLSGIWRLKGFAEFSQQYQKELDECLKAYPPPKK